MGIAEEVIKALMTEKQKALAETLKAEFVQAGSQKISDPAVKTMFNRYAEVEYQLMQENLLAFSYVAVTPRTREAVSMVMGTVSDILEENKTEFEARLRRHGVAMERLSENQRDQFQEAYQAGLEHVRARVLSP